MPHSPASSSRCRPCLPDLLALLALAAGIAVRVARAWAGRVSLDVDQSVVGLMARHIAHGTDFPLFFYGQSYMGSLEPAASGLMFRLFGESGFTLGLGPVLFGSLALWALWRWGRDAGGPWCGLLALLGGMFGPLMHFQFQAAARGGYMVALAVEVLALLTASRMAAALRTGNAPRLRAWAGLGLLAGIGLWSNLIVAPALAVAALLLGWGMRWRPWRHARALAAAVAAAVAGVSPWLWDIARRGGMDALVQGQGTAAPLRTLRCMLDNFRMFLDCRAVPGTAGWALAAVLAVLALLGAALSLLRRADSSLLRNASRAAAAAFVPLFAAVYAFSSFPAVATGRYWIPLAPALALLSALACTLPRRRAARAALLSAWTAVFAVQAWLAVDGMAGAADRSARLAAGLDADIGALRAAGATELLMPLPDYPLNFHSGETLCVTDGLKGFYRPNLRRVELSTNVFISTNYPGIREWLAFTGADFDEVRAGSRTLVGGIRCDLPADREVPGAPHSPQAPGSPLGVLADRRSDTWWSGPRDAPATLEWTLPAPAAPTFIRLQFTHRLDSPRFAEVSGARVETPAPGGGWETCLETAFPLLESSLGRPYPSDSAGILEIPLRGIAADRLRLTLLVNDSTAGRKPWRLAEAALFAAESPGGPDRADTLLAPDATRPVADFLAAADPSLWLFAPRRLCGLLAGRHGADPGRLAGLPAGAFGESPAANACGLVPADRPAALCVEPRMLPAAERALRTARRTWTRRAAGPWTLLLADPAPGTPYELAWDGDAPLASLPFAAVDARIDAILRALQDGRDASAAILDLATLRPEALAAIPPAAVQAAGGDALSALRAERGTLPANPCDAAFRDGLRLRGVDASPASARPGSRVAVTLYWQASGKPHPGGPETTFIHLCDASGRIVAQADWTGLANIPGRGDFARPLHELQAETIDLALPAGLSPGPLQIRVGRHRPGWRWRVPVSALGLPVAKRAVRLDGLLAVAAP